MNCHSGRLRAYLDGALNEEERVALESHLRTCAACQAELAVLQRRGEALAARLAMLDPNAHERSEAKLAWARLRQQVQKAQSSPMRRIAMIKGLFANRRWRPVAAALGCLAVLVFLFSFGPVRKATAEFLGVFRVRKFAVIPVDMASLQRVEGLAEALESGVFGEPTFVRQPGPPQEMANTTAAALAAGFAVRAPSYVPEGSALRRLTVSSGPKMRMEVAPETMRAILAAIGAEGVTLPSEALLFEADFGAIVVMEYSAAHRQLSILQMPSPVVTFPAELDPELIGRAGLRLLGLPEADVERLAQAIDWTSTLVIPLPKEISQFSEVKVDGVQGIAMEARLQQGDYQAAILWQREGIVYAVIGENVSRSELFRVADSLR